MFLKSLLTNTTPLGFKFGTCLGIAHERMRVLRAVFAEGLFAVGANEVCRAVDRHVGELCAVTTPHFARVVVSVTQVRHVFAESMSAKTQRRWTYHFAISAFWIYPVDLLVFLGFVSFLQMFVLVWV